MELLIEFSLTTALAALVGVVLGYVVGSIPGLTATMTIALLLPFTFGLDRIDAIVLMISIFIGAMNGGTLSACMYNIPGTPSAAATVLDGYPLTQKGKFGEAVSIATIASFVGTIISVFALALFAPVLARFALNFSAPEYFAIAVFGLTIVASVSGTSLVRGFLAAILGAILAMAGLDPMTAAPRLTFGTTELLTGFEFVPVLIGLFGMSEILKQTERAETGFESVLREVRTKIVTLGEVIQQLPNMVRSALIGVGIGVIPGTGGMTAAFLSYREAMRWSKKPEEFGKGSLYGVAAPEAGNNGVTGGSMIPLLTFGIPGDPAVAVVLGAFLIHGLVPGAQLFVTEPALINGLIAGMFLASIIMLVQGLLFIKLYAHILRIDPKMLMPVIAVLTVVGAYATNTSFFDVFVMLGFGVLGYLFSKASIPLTPLVLGLILGPILESNLRRAIILDHGSFTFLLDRPITIIILSLAVLSLGSALWTKRRAAEPVNHKAGI